MYTEVVEDHFRNPRNMGEIKEADGVYTVGNPVCGDMMQVQIKVGEGRIEEIRFKTFGCVAAVATTSMMTEMAKGKTLEEAEEIEFKDIEKELGGLPKMKVHCAQLAVQALRGAIKDYRKRAKN